MLSFASAHTHKHITCFQSKHNPKTLILLLPVELNLPTVHVPLKMVHVFTDIRLHKSCKYLLSPNPFLPVSWFPPLVFASLNQPKQLAKLTDDSHLARPHFSSVPGPGLSWPDTFAMVNHRFLTHQTLLVFLSGWLLLLTVFCWFFISSAPQYWMSQVSVCNLSLSIPTLRWKHLVSWL